MKAIHKITLGIALAIVAISAGIVTTQSKSNIKEVLLSQNIEALTAGESFLSLLDNSNYRYELIMNSCTIPFCTVRITGGTIQITGTYDEVEAFCKASFSKYTIMSSSYKTGHISYCKDGKQGACFANGLCVNY